MDDEVVLVIWRDACFIEEMDEDSFNSPGVFKGTVGVLFSQDDGWLHLEQDINFNDQEKKRHVYSIPKASVVEIINENFIARLTYWRKQGV